MKYLKYLIIFLIVCNIPSYLLAYFSGTLGSLASYTTSLALLLFFFLAKPKHRLVFPFIFLGVLYFLISSFNFSQENDMEYIKDFGRFMIVAICAGEVLRRTTKKELFFFLLLGGLSIIINAVLFPMSQANFSAEYGRYSGFYLNPNYAGVICLAGYALSFAIKNKRIKYIGFLVFTLAGIFTFSRTFVVVWLLINILSSINNRKNAVTFGIGGLILILVFAFSGRLSLNTQRFSALQSIFSSDQVHNRTITSGGRGETWSYYYDMIMENPIVGNGYRKLQSQKYGGRGVHNSYLMVIGEAGIIPFLVMISIYGFMLIFSFQWVKSNPEYFYLSVVLVLAAAVSHGYFVIFLNVFLSMFIWLELKRLRSDNEHSDLISAA